MVILDQAGWHTARELKVPKNLTTVTLPPAGQELNAAENIWQYLRQTYFSNRVFKSYTDILDACQEAWQKLLNETGRIASIATRDWAIIGQSIRRPVLVSSHVFRNREENEPLGSVNSGSDRSQLGGT
jgi:DDE superfamily endonuclease